MPSRLDNYSIVERIQVVEGATWYRAMDDRDRKPVILIVFGARRSMTPHEQLQDLRAREEALGTELHELSSHPKIVPWLGVLTQALVVAYEVRDGIPLTAWLERYGSAAQIDAISLSIEVLDALAFAHDRGVLHRGLSPAMVWVEDAPKLSLRGVYGFGVASLLNIEKTWAGTSTAHADARYMAPEQFTAEPLQAGTDLYSVGLLAHQMLSGAVAVEGDSVYEIVRAHCDGELRDLPTSLQISDGLRACISKALRREASQRYVNARQMMHALRGEMQRATQIIPRVHTTQPQYTLESSAHPQPLFSKNEARRADAADAKKSSPVSAPGHARAVNVSELPTQSGLQDLGSLVEGRGPEVGRKQPWKMVLGVGLTALVIAAAVLWSLQNKRPTDDVSVGGEALADVDGAPADCRWEHVVRSVRQGRTELRLSGAPEVVLEYDRMNARVMRRDEMGLRPIRYIRAFGSLQMWHRHLPESGRDWIFLLPRVRNAQRPTLRALQFEGDTLLTVNSIPLSLETAERVRVQLRVRNNTCLLWVRVEGDKGPGPSAKEVYLRMVDPGVVVESGALGGLWAPPLDKSPL